jgi:uncharacterized membrane protein YhaH (DUF805 family)
MQKSESNYNMIDWWKKVVFQNYANFSGRARRSEYWYFVLGQFCLIIPFYALGMAGLLNDSPAMATAGLAMYGIIVLASIIPALAVAVRRLHDTNKSGWYYFIGIIPFIGAIILLVWFFTEGDRSGNNYGNDPKNLDGPVFDFEQTQTIQS